MVKSKIQWTDHTVNFWFGCKKVSDGCKACYMWRIAESSGKDPQNVYQVKRETIDAVLKKAKSGDMIFTCSMSDFFIEEADEWRKDAWDVIRSRPDLIWQILTKRPERIQDCLPLDWGNGWEHVWLGTSIETQKFMNRARILATIPAKTRIISAESLLDELDFSTEKELMQHYHWVIVGGESGNEEGKYAYRECKQVWIEKIINDLRPIGVAVFVKQMGTHLADTMKLKDKKFGGDMQEWPTNLQVREFPASHFLTPTPSVIGAEILKTEKMELVEKNNENVEVSEVSLMDEITGCVITLDQIMKMDASGEEFLLDGVLQKHGLALLAGSSDTGKSYLGIDFARAICNNDDEFIGKKLNITSGSAIVIATEDTVEDIRKRFEMMASEKTKKSGGLRFIFQPDNLVKCIQDALLKSPADLVVVDTFGDLFIKDLNSSIQVRQFLKPIKRLAMKHKCLILFIHHIGKGKENNGTPSKNDVLGSQGIESACRTVIALKKQTNGKRILTVVKANHLPDTAKNKGIVLNFDTEQGFTPEGNTIDYASGETDKHAAKADDEKLIALVKDLYPVLKSSRKVAEALAEKGVTVGKTKVNDIINMYCPPENPAENADGQQDVA